MVSFCLFGCGSKANDSALLDRLNKRLPKYNADPSYKRDVPRYEYDEDLPLYESPPESEKTYINDKKYPTYDSEADNPIYPSAIDVKPTYEYPTYDPEADNPYYNGQTYNNGYDNKIDQDFYPIYDSEADNPAYPYPNTYQPQYYYGQQPAPQHNQYKYPTYEPEADNPVIPDNGGTLFNKPSFDSPVFER